MGEIPFIGESSDVSSRTRPDFAGIFRKSRCPKALILLCDNLRKYLLFFPRFYLIPELTWLSKVPGGDK